MWAATVGINAPVLDLALDLLFPVDYFSRYPGTETLYEMESGAAYATTDPVPRVAQETMMLLEAAGWHGAAVIQTDENWTRDMTRGGGYVLNVVVTVARGMDNKTMIQYNILKK